MSMNSTDWERLRLPAPLPELIVTPDHMQIFMFSAVTWNRHHIHYSKDAALAEGLPDVVVQRALIGNFFARLLTQWLEDAGDICELSWKVTHSALPGHRLRCNGDVLSIAVTDAARHAECELRMHDDAGRVVASGHARLRLPR